MGLNVFSLIPKWPVGVGESPREAWVDGWGCRRWEQPYLGACSTRVWKPKGTFSDLILSFVVQKGGNEVYREL